VYNSKKIVFETHLITGDLTYAVIAGLVAITTSLGWPNFIPLKKFKDPSGGYLVESNCIVKAGLTIVGSFNDG
jgi:hypothetical protein